MKIESLECPNCGAPLPLRAAQMLAACVYCNSTIRIAAALASAGQPPAPVATRAVEVPPAAIDEVKRLLLLGRRQPAVDYYSREAGVPAAVAETAINGIAYHMAYYPPLTPAGVVMLAALEVISLGALLGGAALLVDRQWVLGVGLVLLGAFLALGNALVLVRGLRGFILERRGRPARAKILKRWIIRTDRVRGLPVELTRLLLEVQPDGQARYQAEANCFVSAPSKAKFEPGALIRVKYDPNDRQRLVVTGAGT